jgi:anti-anti-sigma factor
VPGLPCAARSEIVADAMSARGSFGINAERRDDAAVLHVAGDLDLATADALDEAMRRELAAGRAVTLEMSHVAFMDSSGMTLLERMRQASLEDGFSFEVVEPSPPVRRLLELADWPSPPGPPRRFARGDDGRAG